MLWVVLYLLVGFVMATVTCVYDKTTDEHAPLVAMMVLLWPLFGLMFVMDGIGKLPILCARAVRKL